MFRYTSHRNAQLVVLGTQNTSYDQITATCFVLSGPVMSIGLVVVSSPVSFGHDVKMGRDSSSSDHLSVYVWYTLTGCT